MTPFVSQRQRSVIFPLLRIGVAFSLLYAAYGGFVSPTTWIGYFPDITFGVERVVVLHAWSGIEVVLGVWILSGWRVFVPSLFATVALLAVVLFNTSQLSVLFRDVPIAFMAAALAVWSYPSSRQS